MSETIEISPTDLGNWFFSQSGDPQPISPEFTTNPTTGTNNGKFGIFYTGSTPYYAALWFRFAIPFGINEITITRVRIKYQKYQTVPHFGELVHVGVLGQDSDYPTAPTSIADIETIFLTASGRTNESGVGEDAGLGAILYHQDSKLDGYDNFADTAPGETIGNDGLNVIMNRIDWAAGNNIFVALYPNGSTASGVKIHIGGVPSGFSGAYTIEYPKLVLEYDYVTPAPVVYDGIVVHTLVIEQFISVKNTGRRLEHTLDVEQDIAWLHVHNRTIEHDLTIVSLPHCATVYSESVVHYAIPSQTISESIARPKTVEHVLSVTQDITYNTRLRKQVKQELVVIQDTDWTYAYGRSVEDVLTVTQTVDQGARYRTVTHALKVEQDILAEGPFGTSHNVMSVLVITQDIDRNVNVTRPVISDLTIVQDILGYGPGSPNSTCNRRDLAYSAAGSSGMPAKPNLVRESFITLELASPSSTLLLPTPLFGDREELSSTRIQRKTRGGVLKTFSDDVWPKVRTFRYKFEGLDDDKVEETFLFFSNSLGLQITLTDHENRSWVGYIVNPQGESMTFFRQCGNTTEFDFEGEEL